MYFLSVCPIFSHFSQFLSHHLSQLLSLLPVSLFLVCLNFFLTCLSHLPVSISSPPPLPVLVHFHMPISILSMSPCFIFSLTCLPQFPSHIYHTNSHYATHTTYKPNIDICSNDNNNNKMASIQDCSFCSSYCN